MELDSMDYATLQLARMGNMQPLIEKLRGGQALRREERDFIADRLEGKKTNKRGVKANPFPARDFEAMIALDWLVSVEGWPRDAAANRIGELIGETVRTVRNRVNRAEQFNSEATGFALTHELMQLPGNPPLFKAGKEAKLSEADLDQYRPRLLRNEKHKE